MTDKHIYRVCYSCHDKTYEFGIDFIFSTRVRDRFIKFKPVNEKICKLRIEGKTLNISNASAHDPTKVN